MHDEHGERAVALGGGMAGPGDAFRGPWPLTIAGLVSFLIVTTVDGIALTSSTTANVALLRRVGGNDATHVPVAMYMQNFVLSLLLPVWVVFHTNAPRWSVSAFVIINAIMVVLFQVRVGKTVQTIRQGGAAFRRAG